MSPRRIQRPALLRLPRARRRFTGLILLLTLAGCGNPNRDGAPADVSLTVGDVLNRTISAYERLQSLDARGWLRDYRGPERRVRPIRWELSRPELCRMQLDMDMVLVKGPNWWSYRQETGQFKSHTEGGATPMEAATYFLSDGIPFLTPVAWNRPRVAFGPNAARSPWRLDGLSWTGGRPCYVVSRESKGGDHDERWTLWIDQDRFLVVAWTWGRLEPDAAGQVRETTVWGCTYELLATDRPIPPDRFRIERPTPISLPRPTPSSRELDPG